MTFARIAGSCLNTPRDGILDHAQTLSILIHNILISPAPLYRIAEWAAPIDHEILGLSATQKEAINDDRLARSLDALTSPNARNLFFRLALHIIKHFELDTSRIHQDTTSVTFHGQYKSSDRTPRITHGFNKDHRPDLKQLVFGLNVCADGAVPICHEVYSGNRTDDTVHRSNVARLREILGRDDFIYVADSKLCTRKNLEYVAGYGGKFVTVFPRTRAEETSFRKKLREGTGVRWRKLLEMENKRCKNAPPVIYWTSADGPKQSTEGYRIVWCRSSQKAQIDAEAREAALQKAEAELVKLYARLNRGKLRKQAPIKQEVNKILRTHRCQRFLQVRIAFNVHTQIKYLRAGRPRKNDPAKRIRIRIYRLECRRDKQALQAEARTDGVFSLITNLTTTPKKEILLIYKYQPYIEKRYALFKTELGVAPVYLKKPNRAAGLVHTTFLAMMVDALIERALRRGMEREGIEALPILPEGRMTRTPTTARVLEMFSGVSWYEFEREDETVTFPIELTPLQRLLLRLLDIDPSVYA